MISLFSSTLQNPVGKAGFFIFLLVISASGCDIINREARESVVVQVEDQKLTAKEFAQQLARRLKDLDSLSAKDPAIVSRSKEEIIKAFITRSLTIRWAHQNKITISEVEIEDEVRHIRSAFPDDLAFRKVLAEENLSFSEWREGIKFTLLEKAVFSSLQKRIQPPTDAEMKAFYESSKDFYRHKEKIYMRHILLSDQARADIIKAEAKGGDFAVLAKKYSIAPDAKEGGLIGWMEKGSVDYFDPLFTRPIGVTEGPIKSPFGYHLVRIERKMAAGVPSFEEAKDSVKKRILAAREQSEYISWLDKQIRETKILKDWQFINKIEVQTKGRNE